MLYLWGIPVKLKLVVSGGGDAKAFPDAELVLDLFDSSYWLVTAKNPEVLRVLKGRFSDVRPEP
jgi:hypothetical protein